MVLAAEVASMASLLNAYLHDLGIIEEYYEDGY